MPKKEQVDIYCKAYLENGGNKSEAYRKAYPKQSKRWKPETVHNEAYKLHKSNEVSTRLAELQERHTKRHDVSIDRVSQMYLEDREFAKKLENPSAAVSATTGFARLHGLIVSKHADVTPKSTEEIDTKLSRLIEHGEEDRDSDASGTAREDRKAESTKPVSSLH